jgi:hypothetical protein
MTGDLFDNEFLKKMSRAVSQYGGMFADIFGGFGGEQASSGGDSFVSRALSGFVQSGQPQGQPQIVGMQQAATTQLSGGGGGLFGGALGGIGQYAMPAITGGLAGYGAGQSQGPLGMATGGLSGGLAAMALGGGPIGIALGGAAGLLGGLFGWLFGRRLKKELAIINNAKEKYEKEMAQNAKDIENIEAGAQRAKYLDELAQSSEEADAELADVAAQAGRISAELNPSRFKKSKAKAEAARIRDALIKENQTQQYSLRELGRQLEDARIARLKLIEETEKNLTLDHNRLVGLNVQDPFRFNIEGFRVKMDEINFKYQEALREFRDSPEILERARQIREQEIRKANFDAQVDKLKIRSDRAAFDYELRSEHLKATGADEAAILEAEKQKQLQDLDIEMAELRLRYADNQQVMAQLTQYYADRRVNIEKEANEKIRESYQSTTSDIASLIDQRNQALGQYDFTRGKTRTQQLKEDLAEIDEQIRSAWPSFVKQLQGLSPELLGTFDTSQLNDLYKQIQTAQSFSKTSAFNNIVNINVDGSQGAQAIANTIVGEVDKLLSSQKRFAST